MRRTKQTDGRFSVKTTEREHSVPSFGAAVAVALDWASRLPEEGSVAVLDMGTPIGAARGNGSGEAVLHLSGKERA